METKAASSNSSAAINSPIKHLLFIELLGGIGDLLIALPAIQALAFSQVIAKITVLTFSPGSQLLAFSEFIDEVIAVPRGQARQAVASVLDKQLFDLIVCDTNYEGIPELIANSKAGRAVTNLWRNPPDHQWVGDRFLEILEQEGLIDAQAGVRSQPLLALTPDEIKTANHKLAAFARPLVFLIPDSGMGIKRWSAVNFVIVGKLLQERYGATILVPVGTDELLAQEIVTGIGGSAQIWPRGDLREFAAILAQGTLAIAVDTGPARIAAACKVPTISLFGPSWYGRYGQPEPHVNFQGYPACPHRKIQNFTEQNCWYGGNCPFVWETCVDGIAPQIVFESAVQLLESPKFR